MHHIWTAQVNVRNKQWCTRVLSISKEMWNPLILKINKSSNLIFYHVQLHLQTPVWTHQRSNRAICLPFHFSMNTVIIRNNMIPLLPWNFLERTRNSKKIYIYHVSTPPLRWCEYVVNWAQFFYLNIQVHTRCIHVL